MFRDYWQNLDSEAANHVGTGILKRMAGEGKPCPMYLGLRLPEKTRVFVLQVPKEVAPLPETVSSAQGFELAVRIMGDEILPGHVSVILTSAQLEYNEIFASIAEDLYLAIHDFDRASTVVATFLARVLLWEKFFERGGVAGLSEEAQKGLYGELRFIDGFALALGRSPDLILKSWTGPRDRQHDFQFGRVSVEVKATSAKQRQILHIASEQQLDETQVAILYLYFVSLSLVENSQETLPEIITRIREKLSDSGAALATFDSGLIGRGYLESHRDKYINTGYSIRETQLFQVTGDFPRIVERDLRAGVGDVKYTISVADCLPYSVSEEQVKEAIEAEYQ